MNEGPASLGRRRGNRKGGGIYVEREGEKDERGRNRWQVVQPKIWRQSSSGGGGYDAIDGKCVTCSGS